MIRRKVLSFLVFSSILVLGVFPLYGDDLVSPEQTACLLDDQAAPRVRLEPFAEAIPADQIEAEIDEIRAADPSNVLVENKNWVVFKFKAGDPRMFGGISPEMTTYESIRAGSKVMTELARLREITFWDVGEGTGKALDWDNYDNHYTQIVVYNKKKRTIAGGERVAFVDELLRDPALGIKSIYTDSFYNFSPEYFMNVATRYSYNVGRTFVTKEFRGTPAFNFIFMGIAILLKQNSNVLAFDGVASIPGDYTEDEKKLIAGLFSYNHPDYDYIKDEVIEYGLNLARWTNVDPSIEYSISKLLKDPELLGRINAVKTNDGGQGVAALGNLGYVQTGNGPPPLFKTYGTLSARVIGASLDHDFNTVDILLYVTASGIPLKELKKYFGEEGAAAFVADKLRQEGILSSTLRSQPIFPGTFDPIAK